MLLIWTQPQDYAINKLIDHLYKDAVPFFRINDEETIEFIEVFISNHQLDFAIKIQNRPLLQKRDITMLYYRGGQFFPPDIIIKQISPEVKHYLKEEWEVINDYLMWELQQIPHLGAFHKETRNNKLINLSLARQVGFNIPDTVITSRKKTVLQYLDESYILSKCLKKEIYINYKNEGIAFIGNGSVRVDRTYFSNQHDSFFPAQFQNYVNKEIDLRIFYINGLFFSVEIQPKKEVQHNNIDYRKNIEAYLIRQHQLPKILQEKITLLLSKVNLNIASIDLIKQKEKYFFLEINPLGQYYWLEQLGLYPLNKIISSEIKKMMYNELGQTVSMASV